jgi:hypothetical protein
MKDQIVDFVVNNPIVLIPIILIFLPLTLFARYRRMKRRTSHIDGASSKLVLVVGFVLTFIILAGWLLFS